MRYFLFLLLIGLPPLALSATPSVACAAGETHATTSDAGESDNQESEHEDYDDEPDCD